MDRYRQQFERHLTGAFRATHDGRLVECNEAFALLLGARAPADVLTRNARELFADQAGWPGLVASLAPGVVISNHELAWRSIDGTPLTVLVNARAMEDLIEGIAIDITDRKRAEEAERRAMRRPLDQ